MLWSRAKCAPTVGNTSLLRQSGRRRDGERERDGPTVSPLMPSLKYKVVCVCKKGCKRERRINRKRGREKEI